jgi:hypothetical protein
VQQDDGLGGRCPSSRAWLQRYWHGQLRAGRTARWGPVPVMSACCQRAPGVPVDVRRLALALPSQSARAHRLWFSVFPRSRFRITTGYTCDKHSAHLSPIATWHVDNSGFLCTHRHGWRFSQVRGLPWMRLGSGIPSISTAHAQAQRCCAQVIHIFVHSQQVSSPLAGPTDSSRSARQRLR